MRTSDRRSAGPRPPDGRARLLDELIRKEDRERVRRVVAILPRKHRLAIALRYVHGLTEAEATALFERSFGIRLEGTRQILKDGRDMVKAGLEGQDLRVACPNRYARQNKNVKKPAPTYTPPPLFGNNNRGEHGWLACVYARLQGNRLDGNWSRTCKTRHV